MKFQNVGIFFDRDGTINTEVDYLSSPEELELIPGAAEAIRGANELGVKVFIITNQSGISRRLFTEADLKKIHSRLEEMLLRRGAKVDAIYYCPHHPESGFPPYNIECECRKPSTGMLRAAAKEFGVDLPRSFVIGDKLVDVMAGENAGCTSILVLTGYGAAEKEDCIKRTNVAHIAENASGAWHFIKERLRHADHRPARRQAVAGRNGR